MPWHEQVVVTAISPIQKSVTYLGGGFVDIWNHYFNLVGVTKENDRLLKIVDEQKMNLHRMTSVVAQNDRLRRLLDFKERNLFRAVGARVVANDLRGDFRVITIDKGTDDGIGYNMPVMAGAGLIGRVVDIAPDTSRVLLITDPNNVVDVLIQRSRARAMLVGVQSKTRLQPTQYLSRLDYLRRTSDIEDGDIVVTSGLDGLYPADIPIGVVQGVKETQSGVFKQAGVQPFTDFTNLEEVLVVER